MNFRKQTASNTKTSDLEAKVDAMMDVNQANDGIKPQPKPVEAPIDIFAGAPSPVETSTDTNNIAAASDVAQPAQSAPLLPKRHKATPVTEPTPPVSNTEPARKDANTTDDIVIEPLHIDTQATDKAIADIVAQEADEVLAAQDAGIEAAFEDAEKQVPDEPQRRGHPFFWFIIFILVVVIAAAVGLITNPALAPSL